MVINILYQIYFPASKLNLFDYRIYCNQAITYMKMKDMDKGAEVSLNAVKLNPFNIKVTVNHTACK